MPFPAGTVVLCQQRNLSPPGRTHFKENNRYALDLSNTTSSPLWVVSAAPGRATSVYSDADPTDKDAGLGYGNQLKIEHGDGYFTMYAHLDKVSVRDGDVVESGAPLGTVGFTGAAGNRHLHFSLHQGGACALRRGRAKGHRGARALLRRGGPRKVFGLAMTIVDLDGRATAKSVHVEAAIGYPLPHDLR